MFNMFKKMNTPASRKMMMEQLLRTNPQAKRAWEQAKMMSANKTIEQKRSIVENLARERGLSMEQLSNMAKEYGINIPVDGK